MIFSSQLLFSDDQALTAANTDSTNVIDLGVAGTPFGAVAPLNQDIGKGTSIPILVQITESFDNMTSLEIRISIGATAGVGTTVISETISLANAVIGTTMVIHVLPNGITERYLGIEYAIVGTSPTVGKVTAGITMGNQTNFTSA